MGSGIFLMWVMKMKLWIDDVRPAPDGYSVARSVNDAIFKIRIAECFDIPIDVIDIDHDAGDYADEGGDYIKILEWMESHGIKHPIHIHSMNPVGIENMRRVIRKNGWVEV